MCKPASGPAVQCWTGQALTPVIMRLRTASARVELVFSTLPGPILDRNVVTVDPENHGDFCSRTGCAPGGEATFLRGVTEGRHPIGNGERSHLCSLGDQIGSNHQKNYWLQWFGSPVAQYERVSPSTCAFQSRVVASSFGGSSCVEHIKRA